MAWLNDLSDAKALLVECMESERFVLTETFDALLREFDLGLPLWRIPEQLKSSQRSEKDDYVVMDDNVRYYCFVARETDVYPELWFFVAFRETSDGVYASLRELYP